MTHLCGCGDVTEFDLEDAAVPRSERKVQRLVYLEDVRVDCDRNMNVNARVLVGGLAIADWDGSRTRVVHDAGVGRYDCAVVEPASGLH